jgi:hypothetical protein
MQISLLHVPLHIWGGTDLCDPRLKSPAIEILVRRHSPAREEEKCSYLNFRAQSGSVAREEKPTGYGYKGS